MRSSKTAIIIEDNEIYSQALKKSLSNDFHENIEIFSDPDLFAEKYTQPSQLKFVELIVVDYIFDSYKASDKDLIEYIKNKLKFSNALVLWTVDDNVPQKQMELCSHFIPKKIFKLSDLS